MKLTTLSRLCVDLDAIAAMPCMGYTEGWTGEKVTGLRNQTTGDSDKFPCRMNEQTENQA
ncbi:MAG: hypothetical protein MZV70_22085 [Desulfobacterales bacterium]|nr:hypothetical protein [Desulfobacterales bacterium]